MIRIRGLCKNYRVGAKATPVLRSIDLDVERGEFVSIVGPSGSGKTTLLHTIGGLDRDFEGDIEVCGHNLKRLDDSQLSAFRNRTVGFVFQAFYLLPHRSCAENVALPALFSPEGTSTDAIRARTREVMEQVGLNSRLDDLPTVLSGGQRQRIAIARAMFNKPSILLCDEPTGNLDQAMGETIIELFRTLNRSEQVTVLLVTHDPNIARSTSRQLLVEDGRMSDMTTDEQLDRTVGTPA